MEYRGGQIVKLDTAEYVAVAPTGELLGMYDTEEDALIALYTWEIRLIERKIILL